MNLRTAAVGSVVAVVFAAALRRTIKNKGKCYGCSGDCSGCTACNR
jgi:hypothetical protein